MAAISSNGTGGGAWATGSTWTGGVAPADDDSVTILAGDSVLMNADLSLYTGLRTVTIDSAASGTPGMLYFADGTSGYLKIRTGYNLVGSNNTVKGRLLANSNGTWGGTTALANTNKAVILLEGTSKIDATHLDIALYCTQPTNKYVETYKTAYTCTTQSSDVNASTDVITFTSAPPTAGTTVIVRSSGTLPGGLSADEIYYTRTISGNTCKLALQNSDATIVNITSTGSGTLTMYDGHTDTGTAVMNVIQNVTSDAPWTTDDGHDRVVLADIGPADYDQQRVQLNAIDAGGTNITLSANVDSTQYPGARVYLSSRNVSIRSAGTTAGQAIVDFSSATTRSGVFQCEIVNTGGSGTTFYGYGIYSGTGNTISGVISGCASGVILGSGSTISGNVIGCSNGVNQGMNHIISGIISGCNAGVAGSSSYGCTVSGDMVGCSTAATDSSVIISGKIRGCSTGVLRITNVIVSGTISGCTTGISLSTSTFSGTISGCTTGINGGMSKISGTIAGCTTGLSYVNFLATSMLLSGNGTDISYSGSYAGPMLRCISFRHADVANDTRAWSGGGKMEHETSTVPSGKTYSHKFTFENGSYWTVMEWELNRTAPLATSLTVYVKHDSSSLSGDECVRWEIIDPASDPILGGSALATQTALGNTTDWQSFTLAYTRTDDRPVLIRASAKRASGNAYIYMDSPSASGGGLLNHPGMTGGCNG